GPHGLDDVVPAARLHDVVLQVEHRADVDDGLDDALRLVDRLGVGREGLTDHGCSLRWFGFYEVAQPAQQVRMIGDLPVVRTDDVGLTDLGNPAAGNQLSANLKVHRVDALGPVAQ